MTFFWKYDEEDRDLGYIHEVHWSENEFAEGGYFKTMTNMHDEYVRPPKGLLAQRIPLAVQAAEKVTFSVESRTTIAAFFVNEWLLELAEKLGVAHSLPLRTCATLIRSSGTSLTGSWFVGNHDSLENKLDEIFCATAEAWVDRFLTKGSPDPNPAMLRSFERMWNVHNYVTTGSEHFELIRKAILLSHEGQYAFRTEIPSSVEREKILQKMTQHGWIVKQFQVLPMST